MCNKRQDSCLRLTPTPTPSRSFRNFVIRIFKTLNSLLDLKDLSLVVTSNHQNLSYLRSTSFTPCINDLSKPQGYPLNVFRTVLRPHCEQFSLTTQDTHSSSDIALLSQATVNFQEEFRDASSSLSPLYIPLVLTVHLVFYSENALLNSDCHPNWGDSFWDFSSPQSLPLPTLLFIRLLQF